MESHIVTIKDHTPGCYAMPPIIIRLGAKPLVQGSIFDFAVEVLRLALLIATRQRIHFMGIWLQFGILIVRLLN